MQQLEKAEQLICSGKHQGQQITWVLNDTSIPCSERLLCELCLNRYESLPPSKRFEKIQGEIDSINKTLNEKHDENIKNTTKGIQSFKDSIQQVINNITGLFKGVSDLANEWIKSLIQMSFMNQKKLTLIEELQHLDEPIKERQKLLYFELNQKNIEFYQKIKDKINIKNFLLQIHQSQGILDEICLIDFDLDHYQDDSALQIKKFDQQDTPKLLIDCHHQSKIIYVDINRRVRKEQRLKCINCPRGNSITVTEFVNKWKSYNENKQKRIIEFKQNKIKRLGKIKKKLNDYEVKLYELLTKMKTKIQESIFKLQSNQKKKDSQKEQILNFAEELSSQNAKSQDEFFLDKIIVENEQFILQQIQLFTKGCRNLVKVVQKKKKKDYTLINEQVTQTEMCYAIAFNKDGSQMVSGYGKEINIWNFKSYPCEIKTILSGHKDDVTCLVHSQKYDWFVSGGAVQDTRILLWKYIVNNQWISSNQENQHHSSKIRFIKMNKNEDSLFSCAAESGIKVWDINYQNNTITEKQQLNRHQESVYSFDLNSNDTCLISCGADKQIIIWEKDAENKWQFKKSIQKDNLGYRICFINDNMLAFQYCKGLIDILTKENNDLKIKQQIDLKTNENDSSQLFPQIYSKSKKILILKHNKYVFLIKLTQNGQFKIKNLIDFDTPDNFGALTSDEQSLVIWNKKTKQFKVYKYQ